MNTIQNKQMLLEIIKTKSKIENEQTFNDFFEKKLIEIDSQNTPLLNKNKELLDACFFFLKMNKKSEKSWNNICIRPNKIQENKLYFQRKFGFINTIIIKTLFVRDLYKLKQTIFDRIYYKKLSQDPFIIYTIVLNKTMVFKNRIFIKKSFDDNILTFEAQHKINLCQFLTHLELYLEDSMSKPILFLDKISIKDSFRGNKLVYSDEFSHIYYNKNLLFFSHTVDLLQIEDNIMINGVIYTIMDTCCIKEKKLSRDKHNYMIIRMSSELELPDYYINIMQTPILHLLIQ